MRGAKVRGLDNMCPVWYTCLRVRSICAPVYQAGGEVHMAAKITAVILAAAALLLTFKGRLILTKVFRIPEPSDKQILWAKFAALGIAVIAFITVFRVG